MENHKIDFRLNHFTRTVSHKATSAVTCGGFTVQVAAAQCGPARGSQPAHNAELQ